MSGGVTKGAVASEVRGRGRGWEMNLQETQVSNGGPRAEGGPSPRHSASGDFSGRCAHGAALRRPDGSVATAAPQPSGKEEDSCALALLTAAVSGHPEHCRLSTGTSASLLSSAFVIFFWNAPRTARIPALIGDHSVARTVCRPCVAITLPNAHGPGGAVRGPWRLSSASEMYAAK